MTPLPKKKHSKSRSRTRASAISLNLPNLSRCKNCDNFKLPHRICPNCKKLKPIVTSKEDTKVTTQA